MYGEKGINGNAGEDDYGSFDPFDLFGRFSESDFGFPFDDFDFGFSSDYAGGKFHKNSKTPTIETTILCSLEELYLGVVRDVVVVVDLVCNLCKGKGHPKDAELTCKQCSGTGYEKTYYTRVVCTKCRGSGKLITKSKICKQC